MLTTALQLVMSRSIAAHRFKDKFDQESKSRINLEMQK